MENAHLRVQVVGRTEFVQPDVPWFPDVDAVRQGGQALAEFAGRACYQSWSKPNPATATNAGYIAHILEVGHFSVLEHGQLSVYLTGVSRSLTHELVRHRHFSYSQLSQRFVSEQSAVIEPEDIADDPDLHAIFTRACTAAQEAYGELADRLAVKYADEPNATLRRKRARQAARSVLLNATETRIVVTGNYRAWRKFVQLRASEHADVEIRDAAIEILRTLQREAPNVFADFVITEHTDGSEIASTPHPDAG